jgi:NADPH:quinone reductase-like Zn-dependent oxidoreductase
VCCGRNVELIRSLGADHAVDQTQEDFSRSGRRYDLILDVVGNRSLPDLRRALAPSGTLVLSGGSGGRIIGPMGLILGAVVRAPLARQKPRALTKIGSRENLNALTELIESGRVKPVIDRTFGLTEVPEAARYVEEGHARGKVVITVA